MDEKYKVAIIAGQLVVGGAERQLYLWLANMDRERFDPLVITLHPFHNDYWEKPIEALGIPLFRVAENRAKWKRLAEIIKILRPFHPAIIRGCHSFSSVYAGFAGRILGIPCIGGIRSQYLARSKSLAVTLVKNSCNAFVVNSHTAAIAYQMALGKTSQTIFTVPNAVLDHPTDRENLREQFSLAYKLPMDFVWICSVGRMDPLKRFDVLLNMVDRLREEEAKFHVIIIGDGPEKVKMQHLVNSLKIDDHVSLLGEIPNAGYWMKAMDIFCFPSLSEGLPNAVMEAAAAGLPIVAWKLPFNEELLPDKRQAVLVEPENMEGMTSAVSRLIKSPDLRTQLGSSAQTHILEHFGLERYIQNLTMVYESVIKRNEGIE